jgi:GntR family transcriptional regulator
MKMKYLGIASDIRGSIERGELQPGDRAPTVAEICERYDVSDATAMQVLRQLDRWEVIVRRSRRGSWVRGNLPHRLLTSARFDRAVRNAGPSSYEREVAECGYVGEVEYLFVGWADADHGDACMLGVSERSRIVVRSRRQWATPLGRDGQPVTGAREVVQLMHSVFPEWVGLECPAILEKSTGPGGSYSRIDDVIGLIDTATETISPSRQATLEERDLFGFERATKVTQVTRRAYVGGAGGQLVDATRCVMLPFSTQLEYTFPIGD